jgi:hypothetical protein
MSGPAPEPFQRLSAFSDQLSAWMYAFVRLAAQNATLELLFRLFPKASLIADG